MGTLLVHICKNRRAWSRFSRSYANRSTQLVTYRLSYALAVGVKDCKWLSPFHPLPDLLHQDDPRLGIDLAVYLGTPRTQCRRCQPDAQGINLLDGAADGAGEFINETRSRIFLRLMRKQWASNRARLSASSPGAAK